ncbi:hypothetical protein [Pseudomonas sp. 5P_3.1_Bac2]|uniref:hypothetical protein n=1 Tax=Pseudomonas sp. 5P_3.1_Bac2 TaxID=2971617 RepID=UPI0021C6A4D1|nr:hypothetical protein [Pseudomonas sp. 5P_3.1_Bac2]MCU1719154.1 hypothetical protein [Pseudomonas sp. 5P_3.1_Bac2]
MVIHYGATPENTACGRKGLSLNSTQDQAQVSCKRCQQAVAKLAAAPVRKTPSLADLRAAAKAAKAAAEQPARAASQAPDEAPLAAPTALSVAPGPALAVATAVPVAKPAPAPSSVPSEAPAVVAAPSDNATAPIPRQSARAEWLARLQQLPGRNRLPRGAAKQSKR